MNIFFNLQFKSSTDEMRDVCVICFTPLLFFANALQRKRQSVHYKMGHNVFLDDKVKNPWAALIS